MSVASLTEERVLLPFRHLRWRSTIVALAAAGLPACGAVLWLASQGGRPRSALMLTGLLMVTAGAISWLTLRAQVTVDADGVRFRTLTAVEHRVTRDRVRRAVLRTIHDPGDLTVTRHLFLLDAQARTVFRMCDRWWTEAQLGSVARHFQVPFDAQSEAVHLSELRRTVPAQLQWRERHPVLARTGYALAGFAGCLIVGWLATNAL